MRRGEQAGSEVKNILVLSQLGVETGAALADILLGKAGSDQTGNHLV